MKKNSGIILTIVIILAGIAWYLISPAFRVIEVNEHSPLEPIIKDNLESMDEITKQQFEQQVDDMRTKVMIKNESSVMNSLLAQGMFKPRAHEVQGNAFLIEKEGKKFLRFENFETINGPDLHIYLSSELAADDFVDLGQIKATKGNVNYEIPDNIDTSKYNKVLVWCKPFGVLFSYAGLSS